MRSGFSQKLFLAFAATLFLIAFPVHAQIDLRAVARLHFKARADSANWFEGFARASNGTEAPYVSHRSAGEAVPAYVARTQGQESTIAWETAPLPSRWFGKAATFIWACGLGSNLGDEKFVLTFNDKHKFIFSTSMQPAWQITGEAGSLLSFTAVFQNHNRAYFGYMTLTVPAAWVRAGRPAKIKIAGIPATKEIWYRTFAYAGALAYFRTYEDKEVFHDFEFWNLGDAHVQVLSHKKNAGQKISAYASGKLIDEDIFQLETDLAVARLEIPRDQQNENSAAIQLRLNGEAVDVIDLHAIAGKRLKAFLEEELLAERFVFPPGKLPDIQWKRPAMVDNELGKFQLRVNYFDKHMNRVERASEPGRYAAVVEGKTPAGFTIKRYVTLFCAPVDLDDYGEEISIRLNPLPALGLSPALWQKYEKEFRAFSFGDLIFYLHTSAEAATFLAGLSEMDSTQQSFDSPRLRDRQWWIDFKHKQERLDAQPVSFKPPHPQANHSTPELIEASNGTSRYTQKDLQNIRAVCREWAREGREPFAALMAHKGRVIFHEAFGNRRDGLPMTIEARSWMASITKLLTGVLVMQFVDQGLLDLDAPLQNYLPEIKPVGNATLTLRHLLTHTHGGAWHGEWGSDWNPALENYVAQSLPYFEVGKNFQYNRLGYALAGKIMERLSGRAVPYLFEECLFKPLGMNHSTVDNTYGSLYSTCLDLARLGQMLLHRGSYGEYQFFSEENCQKMLPSSLEIINPQIQKRWGIGAAPLGGNGLSDQTFGHEAASGAIFRIDPEQDLILVVARDRAGSNYDDYATRFIAACTAPLRKASGQ